MTNVLYPKLAPVTVTMAVVSACITRGFTELITGGGIIVSELGDVTLVAPTVTVIDPLIAATGTETVSVVAVAIRTVAVTPPMVTRSSDLSGLNP